MPTCSNSTGSRQVYAVGYAVQFPDPSPIDRSATLPWKRWPKAAPGRFVFGAALRAGIRRHHPCMRRRTDAFATRPGRTTRTNGRVVAALGEAMKRHSALTNNSRSSRRGSCATCRA